MKTPSISLLLFALLFSGCTGEIKKENATLKAQVESLTKEKNVLEIELAKKGIELEGVRDRLADAKKQEEQLSNRLSDQQKEAEALRAQLAATKDTAKSLEARITELTKELANVKEDAQKVADLQRQQAENRKGEVVGSVVYYFNENYGYKPDVGSNVYIWKVDAYPGFDPKRISQYLEVKSALQWLRDPQLAENARKTLAKFGVASEDQWSSLGDQLSKETIPIFSGEQTISLSVDGSGSFRRSLAPGKYYLVVRSAHRNSMSVFEISGQISFETIEIKPGEESDVTAKFGVY